MRYRILHILLYKNILKIDENKKINVIIFHFSGNSYSGVFGVTDWSTNDSDKYMIFLWNHEG